MIKNGQILTVNEGNKIIKYIYANKELVILTSDTIVELNELEVSMLKLWYGEAKKNIPMNKMHNDLFNRISNIK